jgi:hypothetical protein
VAKLKRHPGQQTGEDPFSEDETEKKQSRDSIGKYPPYALVNAAEGKEKSLSSIETRLPLV